MKIFKMLGQWNLDLLFFKGVEKTNDEYGEIINLENHFSLTKKSHIVFYFLAEFCLN
jgi:hypothetical protein